MIPFICSLIRKPFVKNEDDDIEVPSISYHTEIPKILFFGLLGVTYFFLAPLILPFLLVYLCLGYIIFRNQVSWKSFSSFDLNFVFDAFQFYHFHVLNDQLS